ncbi:leucine-rich repeat receptor-like protein kinase family protein [Actinidia rufa]|uniref:Leucine-rich repeat receptor-like protein kinase family protein n=1 Tax=Actinidia rufa TaxID=165716 RepID=A0A7J0DTI7_9ERIC|nr:leucine-rich repeat receptor-like protein kinase family protein [Actinidia rufa]
MLPHAPPPSRHVRFMRVHAPHALSKEDDARKSPSLSPSSSTTPTIVSGPQPCSVSLELGNFGNTSPAMPNHPIFSETDDDNDTLHIQYQTHLEYWDSVNSKIITWFSNTSVSSIHSLFTPFKTAKEVCDYLAERYSSVDGANEYQLGLELHHLRFDSSQTLTDFYNKLSNLWNHLAQFEPTWTCPTDAAFYAYRVRSRLRHFLMALPPDYEHIRASLLHRHPLPTVGQALAELRSEETRKKTMVYQHSQPVLATPVWAPLQPPSQSVRVSSPKNMPSGSQKKYCSFCRRDTHSYEDCRSCSKPKRKGYHNRQTAAVTDSFRPFPDSSSSTLTAADVETIVTQVLSRTNLHSSALSTTSDISKTPPPSGLGRPLFTDPSLDIILPVTSPSSAGSPPSPSLPSRIMAVPDVSPPAAPPSVPCLPVRSSTRLGRCARLKSLLLFDNRLSGVIPPELGQLSSLEVLRAGGNKDVAGQMPDELGNLGNLTVLGLADTRITGSIPGSLGRLGKQETLSIYTTMIFGEIPPEIGNCSELKSGRATNSQYCSVFSVLDLGCLKGDLHRRTEVRAGARPLKTPPAWRSGQGYDRSLEMEILSTLPRPMARRRQYFGSGRSDEYSEGGSGELSGDYLARFHGFVLPRSRGFGDKVWRSKCDGTL